MKRLLLFTTLTLISMTTFATGYEGDHIYIDGVQWELLGRPVYADTALTNSLRAVLPKNRTIRSSNWDGFTTFWSIQQEQLYLDSIQYERYDETTKKTWAESMPSDTLLRVFRKYVVGGRIVATWLTSDIRMARGEMIWYEHSFFERNYENERIISIEQGKVGGMKDFQNFVVDGFAFQDAKNMRKVTPAELKKMFPLHLEKHPELAGVKRILFSVKRARVDATGHLIDCEVRVLRPDDNPQLAAEMAEAMKAYHPWRVMFINGEYRAYGIQAYTFPYLLEDNAE